MTALPMTPDDAADLARRVLAELVNVGDDDNETADRARVLSDLAGLRDHGGFGTESDCRACMRGRECPDANRYATGLLRTARLYGVTP